MHDNLFDSNKITPNKPEPMSPDTELIRVNKKSDFGEIAKLLLSGNHVIIKDFYSTGLKILFELKAACFKDKTRDFNKERQNRHIYYQASNRILIPISNHKIALRKSPEIGWLNILYSDQTNDFYLPYPKVQGLNSSWQWYKTGVKFPVLDFKIYPYYGVYFPSKFEHLLLFENYLKKYSGNKNNAIDIGAGCGVLSFQLINNGFDMVYASDINPNALISIQDDAKRNNIADKLIINQGDLFENCKAKADLIVFNPPWLPAQNQIYELDKAIYYNEGLFQRFFENAADFLNKNGEIVILFSNFAMLNNLTQCHPIKYELENNNRFIKKMFFSKKVRKASSKTKRKSYRKGESAEIWVLSVK